MKTVKVLFGVILYVFICINIDAQISFKTEYLGTSSYMYAPSSGDQVIKIGDNKGSAMVYQGMANIPFHMKKDSSNRITAWGIGIGGAYASLNNKNFTDYIVSEIMNLQLGIFYLRPLSEKWSVMASIGAGSYMPFTDLSKMRYKNILGSVNAVFIRHLKPNLDIGAGLAINSTFGYPMVFPAIYLNWVFESKFKANVALGDGMDMSAGYIFNEYFNLSLSCELNGQMALLEKDGKDVIFTHQYIVAGFRPEFKLGKTGISTYRPSYYSDRTLKGIYAINNDYFFTISPYASINMRYGF
jgi:hypothetical protein